MKKKMAVDSECVCGKGKDCAYAPAGALYVEGFCVDNTPHYLVQEAGENGELFEVVYWTPWESSVQIGSDFDDEKDAQELAELLNENAREIMDVIAAR